MNRTAIVIFVLLTTTLTGVRPALAQSDGRTRLTGTVAGSFGDAGPALALAASAGYRFAPHLGFEFTVGVLPDLDFGGDDGPRILPAVTQVLPIAPSPLIFPPLSFRTTGRIVTFGTNLVAEFPTPARRLRQYVSAGGGVANVRRNTRVGFPLPASLGNDIRIPGLPSLPIGWAQRVSVYDNSDTALMLEIGGGVEIDLWKGLVTAADLRYSHLLGEADYNFTRVGARIGYRF